MKNAKKIIIAGYFALSAKIANAQGIGTNDSVISKPVGVGILPGAGTEGTDIKSNVIFSKIIPFLIKWGINLAIGLSVLAVIYGGYLFLTAYGDEEKHGKGIKTLIYAFVGLGLAIAAYAIVTIITRLQFS